MMDVIHSKNDASNITTFSKMRQMKTGLGVDRVDCGNVNAIVSKWCNLHIST
jgi:hypothetical protein